MNKLTRRFKKKRKNKTFKGGSDIEANRPINVEPLKEGVHAVGNVVESVNDTVGDGVGWVKDSASEAVVGTTNFLADKTNDVGNSIIGAIANKVQENMPVNISEQGVDIIENKTEKIIEAEATIAKKVLDETTEIMKEKLPDIANAAGTAAAAAFETIPFVGAFAAAGTFLNKGIEAGEKSLDMVNKIQDVAADAVDTAQETLKEVKGVGDGALSNIPDVGALSNNAIGEASQQINNGINGFENGVSDNVNSATTALNKSIDSGVNNMKSPTINGGFKNFAKQKAQIGGRINDSIAAFTDPIGYQSSILKGGNNNKTKRLVKRNKKSRSRRVRFSF
jgi:hypothetical protein